MLKRRALVVALLMVLAAAPVRAGFQEGVAALERGDFVVAFQEMKPLADLGNRRAQFALGVMYANGHGVLQNDAVAVIWYQLAAEQDYARAQFSLGVMYSEGKGVAKNYAIALGWYRLAAAQDHARAMNNLGVMYEYGQGTPRDLGKAYAWYDMAAANFAPGPERDQSLSNRDTIAAQLSAQRLAHARRLAREWGGGATASPSTASGPPEAQASRPSRLLVIRIQNALAAAGYNPGPADGIMGRKTRRAIRAYQSARKIPVTGQPSADLLRELQ